MLGSADWWWSTVVVFTVVDMSSLAERVARRVGLLRDRDLTAEEQRHMAADYSAVLGWDDPVDEQLARFKQATEGAPLVTRPVRRFGPM